LLDNNRRYKIESVSQNRQTMPVDAR